MAVIIGYTTLDNKNDFNASNWKASISRLFLPTIIDIAHRHDIADLLASRAEATVGIAPRQ